MYCPSQPPGSSRLPSPSVFPSWCPYICFLCLRLFFCFANEIAFYLKLGKVVPGKNLFMKKLKYTRVSFQPQRAKENLSFISMRFLKLVCGRAG